MTNHGNKINDVMDRLHEEYPTFAPVSNIPEVKTGNVSQYAQFDDGDLIHLRPHMQSGDIIFDKPEDIALMLELFYVRMYGHERRRSPEHNASLKAFRAKTFIHEWQHGQIMDQAGIEDIRYGIRIHPIYKEPLTKDSDERVRQWVAHAFTSWGSEAQVTKAAYAMMFAYPREPSSGDVKAITDMGYRDVQHVYESALAVRGLSLAKPLSLR